MESTSCLFCKENGTDLLFIVKGTMPDRGEFRVVQCKRCHLAYLNPRPSPEELKSYYPAWTVSPEEESKAKVTSEEILKREAWKYRLLPGHLKKMQGSVLDIGAGAGEFLYLMRKRGWKTIGVEPSPVTSRYGREALGLQILTGTLPEVDLAPSSFDLVTLWDVIEHLPDPLGVVQKITSLLKEGGVLVFSTPNVEGLPARWFKGAWYMNVPRHLYFFSPKTLQMLIQRAGLKITAIRHHLSLFSPTSFTSAFEHWVLGKSPAFDRRAREWLVTNPANSKENFSLLLRFKTFLDQVAECASLPVAFFAVSTRQAPNLTVYAMKPIRS